LRSLIDTFSFQSATQSRAISGRAGRRGKSRSAI
jgi:hypothetical protein